MIELTSIRSRARDSLEHRLFGNVWITLLICTLAYTVIVGLPTSLSGTVTRFSPVVGGLIGVPLGLVGMVISGPLSYGITRIYHKVALGNKRIDFVDLFCGFKEELGETFLLGFLRSLFIGLWSLLFIIPGIVMSYAYSMAFFIQQESKEKNWRVCLDESKELTRGYKGKLFLLDLSFIGWFIVGALCFGVGLLWVDVYHTMARAHFYEELKRIKAMEYREVKSESTEGNADEPVFEETGTPSDPFAPADTEKKEEE
ncbi:MAG: DUF975 family protein [Clostridia bacterium]|nr:DUF975 family protein [Clostridia bacterium]